MEENKTPTTENKLALTPEYIETYKFDKWLEYYTDEKNPKTYSNGVQAAFAAYGTNISYRQAADIGHNNMKKFKYMRQDFANKSGFTFEKFQKMTIAKFAKGNDPRWYDKVKEVTGFNEILPEQTQGTGIAVKTENKDGTVTEVKIVKFEKPTDDQPQS